MRYIKESYGLAGFEYERFKEKYGIAEYPQIPVLVIDNLALESEIEDAAYQDAISVGKEDFDDDDIEQVLDDYAEEEVRIIESLDNSPHYLHFSIEYPYNTNWCIVVSIDREDLSDAIEEEISRDDEDEISRDSFDSAERIVIEEAIRLMQALKKEMGRFPAVLVK